MLRPPRAALDREASADDSVETLRAELARQQERFDRVVAIGKAIGSTLFLDELLRLVIDSATHVLGAERSTLFLVNYEQNEIWSKVAQGEGFKEIRLPLGSGIAGWVCQHNQPLLLHDVKNDPRFNPEFDRLTGFQTHSMLVVPLHDVTGQVLGAIQVLNRRRGYFTAADQVLLEAIAAQAGVAIEKARLFHDAVARNLEMVEAKEALAESVSQLDLLYDIEKRISAAHTQKDLFDAILAKAIEVLNVEAASILVAEEDLGQLYFKSALGEQGEQVKTFRLALGEGISGHVARTGETVLANDVPNHTVWAPRITEQVGFVTRGALCVPLRVEGEVVGALELLNHRDQRPFDEQDLRLATLIAGQIARATVLNRERTEGERKARLVAIGQMLSAVLHDLRTPMTLICGHAEFMVDEPDREERRRSWDMILKQVEQMSAMAKETLAFARGESDLLLRRVFLNIFLDEFGEFLSKDLEGNGIELKISTDYRGVVRMDEVKMKRALYNVVRNAAQAMPEGGLLTLSVHKDDSRVVFRLTDTGHGIPEEIAHKVFDSFVTAGKEDGTGLGLAIVKKMVEDHGGDVSFESKPGAGTTFTLRIPVL